MDEKLKDKKKRSNRQILFSFTAKSCVYFQSSKMHRNMNAESAIEKLQKVIREKEMQKSEHKQGHEEETKLLKKKEAEEELKKVRNTRVLNIQLLAKRLSLHSPSSLECEEGKAYNERCNLRI